MKTLLTTAIAATLSFNAYAWDGTLKTNEVVGPDGNVYMYASPENQKNIIANPIKSAGLFNTAIYIVVKDKLTWIGLDKLRDKSRAEMKALITEAVVEDITGIDLPYDAIEEATKTSDEAVQEVIKEAITESMTTTVETITEEVTEVTETVSNKVTETVSAEVTNSVDSLLSQAEINAREAFGAIHNQTTTYDIVNQSAESYFNSVLSFGASVEQAVQNTNAQHGTSYTVDNNPSTN